MNSAEVDARISKIFARQGTIAAPVESVAQMEGTSHTTDATVREPANLQIEQPVEIIPAAAPARLLAPQAVVIPEGAPLFGLAALQFQAAWSSYVQDLGEVIQPTLADAVAWFNRELNEPEVPSPLAHLIQQSSEPVNARSEWNQAPVRSMEQRRSADAPTSGRGSFSDFRRPGDA
jgi:hypothetical protein